MRIFVLTVVDFDDEVLHQSYHTSETSARRRLRLWVENELRENCTWANGEELIVADREQKESTLVEDYFFYYSNHACEICEELVETTAEEANGQSKPEEVLNVGPGDLAP